MVANGIVLIGSGIERLSSPDSSATTIVWWADGSPAATEQPLGAGCIRNVAFSAPDGDAMIGESARGVLSALAAPCGVRGVLSEPGRLTERDREQLAGNGLLAPAAPYRAQTIPSPLARWLLLAALALLVVEMLARVRSRAAGATAS